VAILDLLSAAAEPPHGFRIQRVYFQGAKLVRRDPARVRRMLYVGSLLRHRYADR
jgi:hypothetical protein